jgi:outer membrane protein TolC
MSFSFDRPQVVELALKNRMELFDNELQAEINRYQIDVNRNAMLPDVRFDFRYNFAGMANTLNKAFDQLLPKPSDSYQVLLAMQVPLQGNILARANYQQARLQLAQTNVVGQRLGLMVRQEVLNAIDQTEQNWQSVLANRASVQRGKANYDASAELYRKGQITGNELILIQQQLADIEVGLVQALSNFQQSLVDLAVATGTTLGYSGVVWASPNDMPPYPGDVLMPPH